MNAATGPFRQQILLVDDEEDALVELAESLENEGFVCFTATSVTYALQELTLNPDIARGKWYLVDQAPSRTH
jgi:DNA-binding response OmpR family regulator